MKKNNVKFSIRELLKQNKLFCFLGVLISILYAVVVTALPLVSQYLIDVVMSSSLTSQVYRGILLFFGVCILQPLFYYLKEKIFIILCEKISFNLRVRLFEKIAKLPLEYFETHNYGEVSMKIIEDTKQVSGFVYSFLGGLITSIISILFILTAMFYQSIMLSLIIIILFAIYIIANFVVTRKFKRYSATGIKLTEEMQNSIKHSFDNAVLTKVFLTSKTNNKDFVRLISKVKNNNLKIRGLSNLLNTVTMTITTFSLCVIYGLGAVMIIDGALTLGVVISMGLFFQSLTMPIASIISNNIQYNQIKPSVVRIDQLVKEKNEQGDKEIQSESEGIVFKNVSFQYPKSNKNVFENLSFEIEKPGLYSILGKSGSGKSSIAKLILGLYEVNDGSITVFGEDVKEIQKNILRQRISYVTQDIELLNDSVINNLRVANPDVSIEKAAEVCKLLNIHDKIVSLPDDYYSVITEKINLSGGEKRRLAIARALLKDADIYIFDEAETSLETDFEITLRQIFDCLRKDKIVLVITHNLQLVENFDFKIRIDGQI